MVYRNKDLVKRIFPSSVLGFVRKSISRDGRIRLEGEFPNWEKANARHAGYDDPKILEKVLDATLKVKRGEAAYERDSVIFDRIEYSWPLLAGLMWAAAEYGGRLNVLDFGGALGSSYFQNRKFLQTMRDIHWNIVEQSHFVEAGKANIQDNQIRFYKSLKECMDENRPHVLLLSSVIQYLKEPEKLLDEITQLGIDTILIDRTSFTADGGRKCLYIQHVPESIYMARYPIWLFNENEFVESITSKGYALIESFNSLDELDDRGIWKGFIFKSTHIHTCRI
jgi:putative methyltransferase (TIGR04325 family)